MEVSEEEITNSSIKDRTYVFPSARTVSDHKQLLASETESEAAMALLDKDPIIKAILHFDTTSRNNIDGEWPTIILHFSNGEEFRLRPIFFAYEDREQITSLFCETFKRLAAAVSIRKGVTTIEPSVLWEKIDALIMTDAVTKNLEIENTIPVALGSNHHPLHLLCKSHTVEAIDKSNLEVLSKVEKNVNQQEILESINPALKSFFCGKSALVEAGIDALLKLITHNKSANSCSQADQFEHICEREGVTKRVFLYQQRRFAKIGKAAASILNTKDILSMLLDEVQVTNQLVESCKIYLSSDLFMTELECLAYFNRYVTFPFLNCVEVSTQDELVNIIPKLYDDDLLEKKTDTLEKFVIKIHGIPVPELSTAVEKVITDLMCSSAAEAIKRQCGREYGFADDDEPLRATDISKLTSVEREGLPTNNCISERDLSKFDKEAVVSRCRNRKFKAKNIRNNMVLYKSKKALKLHRISKKISLALSDRETEWHAAQKEKHDERLELKLQKAEKGKDYVRRLLQDCKSWGGPATSTEELHHIPSGKDNQQHILRTEVAFYAQTHKANRIVHKDLYRVNSITYEEMLENMMILLDDEKHASTGTVANLPSNADVMNSLSAVEHDTSTEVSVDRVNKICVVAWKDNDGEYEWFLGYVKKAVNNMLLVNHLARKLKNSHSKWKYPSKEDVQLVESDQFVECVVEGEWDLTADSRKRLFTLSNTKTISCAFNQHIST